MNTTKVQVWKYEEERKRDWKDSCFVGLIVLALTRSIDWNLFSRVLDSLKLIFHDIKDRKDIAVPKNFSVISIMH